MLTVSIGAWAGTIANENGWLKLDALQPGDLATALTDGSVWTSGSASDLTAATKVTFGSNVSLNDADLAALKTLLPKAKQLKMDQVSLAEGADIASLETAAVEYLRLPNSMTSEEDVKTMATLKSKNSALKMVGAYDPDNQDKSDSNKKWAEVSLHSFKANTVTDFLAAMDMPTSGNPTVVPRKIKMSGEYGEKDLVSNGATGTPNFGHGTSAEWDFTGAHFAKCKIPAVNASYYNYDDPFCEGELVANTTSSNSFYYFSQYTTQVIDIKLPDTNMTTLPYRCLKDLGAQNKSGYVALYGQSAFDANKVEDNCVPIETLVIPDSYTDLEEECGMWARIRHLVVGSGMKRIHGGAFLKCDYLEDLDFGAGLSDCYVGDRAFNECKSMKHIALSEGIVSLGNGAFWNSQHLESIRLPQSLIDMGNNCFNNCLALNSITIPENVEKIGQNAFTLCPFTDIFLTTTDPDKIPVIWSAGTGQDFAGFDERSTFYNSHIFGWSGIPDTPQAGMLAQMTWDEAADYYYMNVNGCPVLHYPSQLANKVRADISSTYHAHTKADDTGKTYGLPLREDMNSRAQIPGAGDSENKGLYTQNGWAQFMLMKEYTTGPESEVYQKEYDDVWYTMCFPFDLTDEQLAAAFNETFNIVDFSGVEVVEADKNDGESMKLILHFNNVAVTDYKDVEGNHYKRKTNSDGSVVREQHGNFSYNVYTLNGQEYHHVHASEKLSSNKTKTFAPGSNLEEAAANKSQAVMIDGILATAGHPYMIHPAIGVVAGQPKQRCNFSGVEWLPQGISMAGWQQAFEDNSRTIDLGIKKTLEEFPDSNYNHKGYPEYAGQTYTFIGNAKLLRTDIADYPEDLQEPTVENGQLVELPKITSYTTLYPKGPAMPPARKAVVDEYGEKMTEADMPEEVSNPADAPAYADAKDLLMAVRLTANGQDVKYYEDLANYDITEFFTHWSDWGYQNQSVAHGWANLNESGLNLFKAYFSDVFANGYSNSPEEKFAVLKGLAENLAAAMEPYNQYLEDLAAYNANVTAWANYESAHAAEEEQYQEALNTYNTKVGEWQTAYEAAESANKDAIATWQAAIVPYQVYIPKNAYFLGRRPGEMPKYYREMAENPAEGEKSTRPGGQWNQFTAIVIPNDAAVNGIEKGISKKQAGAKGFDMIFNEDFEGTYIDKDDPEVITAIENAKKEGADVKYVDIVVSINGQVVRRGSTSLEGLPQGMYIINGKKYFVK